MSEYTINGDISGVLENKFSLSVSFHLDFMMT